MADFELWVKGRRVERFASDTDPEDADECAALIRSMSRSGKYKVADVELRTRVGPSRRWQKYRAT